MPSNTEAFLKLVLNNLDVDSLLDDAKDFVVETYDVEEIFPDEEIIGYVKGHKSPDEVFSTDELSDWARSNGFVKQE